MSNINAATKSIADKWAELLDAIAEKQVELKTLKSEAKEEGYNLKCIAQCVKEIRKGAKFQADQLTLELELKTYREGVGLPTDVEVAQQRARAEAGTLDDDEPESFGGRERGKRARDLQ